MNAAQRLISEGDDLTVREVRISQPMISQFTHLSSVSSDCPQTQRLLVILRPTPFPTATAQHQIPRRSHPVPLLERVPITQLRSQEHGHVPPSAIKGVHFVQIYHGYIFAMADVY